MGRPAKDLTNQRFQRLLVIKRDGSIADGHAKWLCLCDCGNYISVSSNSLKRGDTKSCGCLNKDVAREKGRQSYKDLTNKRFNKLIAKEYLGSNNKGSGLWRCECDCGNNNFITTSHHLISGNTQSCGCLKSKGEANIKQLLINNNINFISQYYFKDLYYESNIPVRFDFYLPDYNRLIEFDGIQHYTSGGGWNTAELFKRNKKHDEIRNQYALSHNIPLVRIPYWERDNITLEMLFSDEYLVKEEDE